MAWGTQGDDDTNGRATVPAVDAAEHLAAAIGTEAWPQARDQVVGLLDDEEGSAGDRVEAWAAEALRREREDEDPNAYLIDSLPQWQQEIAAALADDPERAEEARRFTETVRSLLPRPDDTGTQVAVATGHGTVNAVQNGNIYYQVVLGLAPRPGGLSRGGAIVATAIGGTGAATGGVAAARHFAAEAVDAAGRGQLPQAALANPAAAPGAGAGATAGGATTPGTTAAAKVGSTAMGKATSGLSGRIAGAVGTGTGGVGVPAVAVVVSVVVVVVTTVTVVLTRTSDHGSCDAAVHGQSSRAVLAEAARRVELTSFRFDITRGPHHVTGAADPQSRNAWFTQGLTDGPVVTGTIAQGEVVLPAGTTVPSGADPRWVRSDGSFTDAVDPAAPARQLRSVVTARRNGCEFTGTLSPSAAPAAAGAASPMAAALAVRAGTASATPTTGASTSPPAGGSGVPFTARIDDEARLVRLRTGAPADGLPVSVRYSDFGLAVTPSVPPSATAQRSPSPSATHTLTGDWAGVWATDFATGDFTAKLAQNGNRMTGRLTVDGTGCDLGGPVSGAVEGDRITFGTVKSTGKITFTGSMDGAGMHGTFSTDCYNATGDWNARRSPTPH
ncbi:hypothetical protein [Streptomyces longwoodensis]|uniref:hypothetical protein n=1 Tax=Streptomyces longwoodensis TaxID=68231 RepID=UPI0033FF2A61